MEQKKMTKKELEKLNQQTERLVNRLNKAAMRAGFKTPKN